MMTGNLNKHQSRISNDIVCAFTFLTVFPIPFEKECDNFSKTAWVWPIIGAFIGIVAASIIIVLQIAGTPSLVTAVIAMIIIVATTGALHEDGLADTIDGIFGGNTPEQRLEIMKDSRLGTYGSLALMLVLLLRFSCLAVLFQEGKIYGPLIAGCVISRAGMAMAMHLLPAATNVGLSASSGQPSRNNITVVLCITILIALSCVGIAILPAIILAFLSGTILCLVAYKCLGGQTGDVLGALQQVVEVSVLVVLAILAQ